MFFDDTRKKLEYLEDVILGKNRRLYLTEEGYVWKSETSGLKKKVEQLEKENKKLKELLNEVIDHVYK